MKRLFLTFVLLCGSEVLAAPASAQIWFAIDKPTSGASIRDPLAITVSSMGVVSRAEAVVGTKSIALTGSANFSGTLSLAGESYGMKTLTVTLYDASNVPTSKSVGFVYQPTLSPPVVAEPMTGQLVQDRTVRVRATCANPNDSTCKLSTSTVFTAGPTLDELVSIPSTQTGTAHTVTVTAKDGTGQTAATSVVVYLDLSDPLLQGVLNVPEGKVLDFDGARALAVSLDQKRASIVTTAGEVTPIYQSAKNITRGELSSSGAVVVTQISVPGDELAHFWNGSLRTVEMADARINGKWLAYVTRTPSPLGIPQENVVLEDLSSGQQVWQSSYTPNQVLVDILALDVSASGSVVWTERYGLKWLQNGMVIGAVNEARTLTSPRTDGINSSYHHADSSVSTAFLLRADGSREHLCRVSLVHGVYCPPLVLAGGFVGYRVPNANNVWRTFRRTPNGGVEEVTAPSDVSEILTMTPSGQMLVKAPSGIYLARTPSEALPFPNPHGGRFVHRQDAWYLLVDRRVFRVLSPGDPATDGGVPDAGTISDAATGSEDAGALEGDSATADDDAGAPGDSGALPDGDAQPASDAAASDDASAATPGNEQDGCTLAGPHARLPELGLLLVWGACQIRRRRAA